MTPCINVSNRYNAFYSAKDFYNCIVNAWPMTDKMQDVLGLPKKISADRNPYPSEEWMRIVGSKTNVDYTYRCFTKTVSIMLDQLCEMNLREKTRDLM